MEKKKYDYLIVGSGLYGLVWAHLATESGKKCVILEKRKEIGGNIVTEDHNGIPVHKYGPHIFHTNNKEVWDFLNEHCKVYNYINQPIANYNDELYNLPFNMNTFYKIFNVKSPASVEAKIKNEIEKAGIENPSNLEEQAISMVGTSIYEKLIKGYTEKQWGRDCKDLPPEIIKRLPLRFTFDNNYFNAKYQGMPDYNDLIENLASGSEIIMEDYFERPEYWNEMAEKVVFTGAIDEFFNYEFGKLDWRTVSWENEDRLIKNYQGVACMNYTSKDVPFTRIIEHRHFYAAIDSELPQDRTLLSYEYSEEYKEGKEKFYPVNDEKNNELYKKYKEKADSLKDKFIFGGRLGEYKYYDMDAIIAKVFEVYKSNK